jgi:hypothetical protein
MEHNQNPESESDLTGFFGPIISKYSRADALADGQLVDISTTAQEAGFKFPAAVTRALWETLDRIPKHTPWQDYQGRLWDVLTLAKDGIRRSPAGVSRVAFQVILSTEGSRKKYVTLVVDLGPGDNAEPVFTLGFPEDF